MSTVGVIEAVFFTASDAYKKDPAGTFKRLVEILHDTPGQVGSDADLLTCTYAIASVTASTTASCTKRPTMLSSSSVRPSSPPPLPFDVPIHTDTDTDTAWTTYEAHQALINSPRYAELKEHFGNAIGGAMKMVHFKATGDVPAALGAGAPEVARFTVKPGVAIADATAIFEQIAAFKVPDIAGTVWGYTVEDEKEAVFVAGWSSVEAHQEALKASSPEAAAFVQKLLAALEVKMVHAKFGKY
ncbi:hypothetical protein EVG20_g446 [Dentipellis fragilis]|uniref:ABM domain-containing protein n=1 Tax=Dentipellis fragilis TaxID=205917 RepID=A0A4Y9ZEK2_9AGAM|nr:hypothetical protein EVG20_g446 [Dentipellis fragilis]